jgi:hypothetical protein
MKNFNHHLKQFILQGGSKDPYITLKAGNVSLLSTTAITFSRFSLCTTFRFKGKVIPSSISKYKFNVAIFNFIEKPKIHTHQNLSKGVKGDDTIWFRLCNNYKDPNDVNCICCYQDSTELGKQKEVYIPIPAFDGNWHKIVVVSDIDQLRFYDNGVLKHTIYANESKKDLDLKQGFTNFLMDQTRCQHHLQQGFNNLWSTNDRKDNSISFKNIYLFPYPIDLPDLPEDYNLVSEAKRSTLYTLKDYNDGKKVDPKILKGSVNVADGTTNQYAFINISNNKGSGTGDCIQTTSDDSGKYANKRRMQFTDCTFSQVEGTITYNRAGPFSLIGPGVWCKYELDVDIDIIDTTTNQRLDLANWNSILTCRLDGSYSSKADYYNARYYYLCDNWLSEVRDIDTGELIASQNKLSENVRSEQIGIYKGSEVLGKKYRFICYCRVADNAFTDTGLLNGAHSIKPKIIFNSSGQKYKITGNIDLVDFRILGCGMAIENMGNLYKAYESNDIMTIPGETGIKFDEPVRWKDPYLEAGKGIWPGMITAKVTGTNWYNDYKSTGGTKTRYIKDYDVSNDTELKTKYGLDKAIQIVNEGVIGSSSTNYSLRPTATNIVSNVPYWTSFIRPKAKTDIILKSDIDSQEDFDDMTYYLPYSFSVGAEYSIYNDFRFDLANYPKQPKTWFRFQQNFPTLNNLGSMRNYTSTSNVTAQPQLGIVASALQYIDTGLTSNSTLAEQEAVYSKPWWVVAKCDIEIEGYNYADMLIVGDDHTAFETYNTNK